ncbi:MAG: PAS domain S-box protein [Anaerolineae bacterium]|nr:PAS domain S-box protein [Anaerolineae bacterium]
MNQPPDYTPLLYQERYQTLVDHLTDGVLLLDSSGRCLEANPSAGRIVGYAPDALVGQLIHEMLAPAHATIPPLNPAVMPPTTGIGGEYHVQRADGTLGIVEITAHRLQEGTIQIVMRDLSSWVRVDEAQRHLMRELNERMRELNCLYTIAKLIETPNAPLAMIYQGIVEVIPTSWQYPDITSARLTIRDHEQEHTYTTANFRPTEWLLSQDISAFGEVVGTLEIHYLEERAHADEGPFLIEERYLLKAIAARLGTHIERMRNEDRLRKLSRAIEQSPSMVVITDTEGVIEYVNPRFTEITGFTAAEALGENPRILKSGLMPEIVYKDLWDTLLRGEKWRGEMQNRRKNGALYWTTLTASALTNAQGEVTHFIAVSEDITERKTADQALLESEQRYALAQRAARVGSWDWHILTNELHWSAEVEGMFGLAAGQFNGTYKAFLELVHPQDRQAVTDAATACIERGTEYKVEYRVIWPDGSLRWVAETGDVIHDSQGRAVRMLGIVQDVTERKRAEDQLYLLLELTKATANADDADEAARVLMRMVCEHTGWVLGETWIPNASETFLELQQTYYTHGDDDDLLRAFIHSSQDYVFPSKIGLPGRVWDTKAPEWAENFSAMPETIYPRAPLANLAGLKAAFGIPILNDDNLLLAVLIFYSTTVRTHEAQLVALVAVVAAQLSTIIQRKRMEQALRESEQRFQQLMQTAADAIIIADSKGQIIYWNPAASSMFGYDAHDTLGKSLDVIIPQRLHEAHATSLQNFDPKQTTIMGRSIEQVAQHKSGREFPVSLSVSSWQQRGATYFTAIIRDITHQQRMEANLRKALAREVEVGEMRARILSMAAHDLRNPLAVIKTTSTLLAQYSDHFTADERTKRFGYIHTAVDTMVTLLDDLLTLGRAEAGKLTFDPAPFNLHEFCQHMLREAAMATGAGNRIDLVGADDCGEVVLDQKLLRHIVGNLLTNALKYSPVETRITCAVTCQEQRVTITIRDRGIGIPAADQVRLFEVFYRANNVGAVSGTGLGLAIVKQSVDLHGGTITFESVEQVGTTFTVTLPCGLVAP